MTTNTSANIRRNLCSQCATLGIPVSGIFELTPRCNLKCKMCYVRLTDEQMAPIGKERTAKQWIQFAQECKDAGMVFLLITGGEPTLRSDFPEIYESLAQMGLSISINTNGTLLTPKIRELWHRLPPAQVNVTLYGVCREDYADLCSNPDAFDAVVETLNWLKKEGILVHLNTTIVPSNYPKWMKLEEFANDRDLELRMTCYCFPPTRRALCDNCDSFSRLTPQEAGTLIAQDLLYREGIDAIKARAKNLSSPLQRSCDLENGDPIQCLAGRSQFWVTWDGRMTPCGMLSTPDTHPFKEGFSASWEQLRKHCSKIRLCPDCARCEHQKSCMNCAAVTFAETGRFDGKPEYMCELNRAYRESVTKLVEKSK